MHVQTILRRVAYVEETKYLKTHGIEDSSLTETAYIVQSYRAYGDRIEPYIPMDRSMTMTSLEKYLEQHGAHEPRRMFEYTEYGTIRYSVPHAYEELSQYATDSCSTTYD